MKIFTLLLMIASISVAQAKVYKCPGKMEGQYTYQERPCKGAKENEHTVKIVPSDEKKITAAQEKLAKEIDASKEKKEPSTVLMTVPANGAMPTAGNAQPANSGTNAAPANPGVARPAPGTPPPAPATPAPQSNSGY